MPRCFRMERISLDRDSRRETSRFEKELVWILVAGVGQPHGIEHRAHDGLPPAAVHAGQPEADVGGHGQVREEGVILENHADAALFGRHEARAGDGLAVKDDAAGFDVLEPRDAAQQRGLAAAAGPQQAADLALFELEGDAVGHAVGAVVFGQSVDLKEWVHDCFRASVLRVRSMMGRRPAAMRARAGAAASRHSPSEVNS